MNTTTAPAGSTARRDRILYAVSTGFIALLMVSNALYFAFGPESGAAFRHLGLPSWFRAELTVAKLLGAAALVVSATPRLVREFAYFGFALTIVSADVAHLSSGDPVWFVLPHAFFLATLGVSYVLDHRLHDTSRHAPVETSVFSVVPGGPSQFEES